MNEATRSTQPRVELHPQVVQPFGSERKYVLLLIEEYESLLALVAIVNQIDWQPATTDELTRTSAAAMQDWFTPEEDEARQHLADMSTVSSPAARLQGRWQVSIVRLDVTHLVHHFVGGDLI